MSEQSLAHPAQPDSTSEQRVVQERFEAASRAYYLLAETDRHPQRLEHAARTMDLWAARARKLA